ncbi:hypothetical protein [Streptomyces klenkii]|nr:hypothetical protein [Streptomyces klenkii]
METHRVIFAGSEISLGAATTSGRAVDIQSRSASRTVGGLV